MFVYAKPKQKQVDKRTMQKKETGNKSVFNLTDVSDKMKTNFENYSGFSFSDMRVHNNSDKSVQLQAPVYTQGDIESEREKHLRYESEHVVKKQDHVQPTLQLKNVSLNDNKAAVQGRWHVSAKCSFMKNDNEKESEVSEVATSQDTLNAENNWIVKAMNETVHPSTHTALYQCAEPKSLAKVLRNLRHTDIIESELNSIRWSDIKWYWKEDLKGEVNTDVDKVGKPADLCGVCNQWLTSDAAGTAVPRKATKKRVRKKEKYFQSDALRKEHGGWTEVRGPKPS